MREWKKVYTGVGGYSLRQHRVTGKWWIFDPKDKLLRICKGKNDAGVYWAWYTHFKAKSLGIKGLDTFTLIPRRGHHKNKFRARKVWKVLCPEVVRLLKGLPQELKAGRRGRDPKTGQFYSFNPVTDQALETATRPRKRKNVRTNST